MVNLVHLKRNRRRYFHVGTDDAFRPIHFADRIDVRHEIATAWKVIHAADRPPLRDYGRENGAPLVAAELYDPGSGLFAPTGGLQSPRFQNTATLLNSGIVLVTGGANTIGTLATAELYQ
jgi:hypothetical protein